MTNIPSCSCFGRQHISNFGKQVSASRVPSRLQAGNPLQAGKKLSRTQDGRHARPLVCRTKSEAIQEAVPEPQASDISVLRSSLDASVSSRDEEALAVVEVVEQKVEERGELVAAFIGAAALFGAGVWYLQGAVKGEEYFAGYLLEQSLSVDNLFVFILVFKYFKTSVADQEKVLTYGILSAAVLRLIMVAVGVELIDSFQPILLLFAGILIYSSYKLITKEDEEEDEDLSNNGVVTFCRRFLTVSKEYDGDNFFTVQNGVKMATPLLLVLAVIEVSDVVFAVDSIPAVFGVTHDPFIVYTSNMFAILSLRALYSFVATVLSELRYLDKAVALVLGFIGVKMIADYAGFHIPTEASLGVVAGVLSVGVGASLLLPEPPAAEEEAK